MNKRYISILSAIFVAVATMAHTGDTISRTVIVESTYTPIIINAVKRNFIPGEIEPSIKKGAIVYANEGMPITLFERTALPVTKAAIAQEKKLPGYIHLGYGSRNNLDGLATYNLKFGQRHSLSVKAGITGWNGSFNITDEDSWHSHLYNAMADIDYRLTLDKHELGATINTGNRWFNYLQTPSYNAHLDITDLQCSNHNQGSLYIKGGFKKRFNYDAHVTYTHATQQILSGLKQRHNEGHLRTEGTIAADLQRYGSIGIGLRSDMLNYSPVSEIKDVHYLSITPQWSFNDANIHYAAGLNIDVPSLSSSPVAISPACHISYIPKKRFSIALRLDGGRQIPTFSYLETLSPYWMRSAELHSSYTHLNARLTGNLRITEGLHLHLHGGYRTTQNAIFETVTEKDGILYTDFANRDAQLAYAGSKLSYDYKQRFACYAEGTFSHWMVKGERDILSRAPQIEAKAGARIYILDGLTATSDIHYVMFTPTDNLPAETSIIDWSLSIQYALTSQWSFFINGDNLLNRNYRFYTGYPSQGINALAGAVFKF